MAAFGRVVAAVVGATVARGVYRALSSGPQAEPLGRTNHRGEQVTLAEGPAVASGAVAGVLVVPQLPLAQRLAATVAVGGAAALGGWDDLTGATDVKGLRGHLGALRKGEVTTGALKLGGLGALGLLTGALARRGRGGLVDAVLAGMLVAGSANLANLFDLRPGRTAKVYLTASAPGLLAPGPAGAILAAPTGATIGLLGEDLGERAMLGDTGANALGAAWGVSAASVLGRRGLLAATAGVVALTLASEKVSFSAVIESTPILRGIDALGRRPAA